MNVEHSASRLREQVPDMNLVNKLGQDESVTHPVMIVVNDTTRCGNCFVKQRVAYRGMIQFGRMLDLGSSCRRFESGYPYSVARRIKSANCDMLDRY